MNRFLLCFTFFIYAATAYARQISGTEAANIASAFYQQRLIMHDKSADAFDISDIVEVKSAEHLVAYAVNVKNGGFVLVSASERTLPVLGYSFVNSFNRSPMPAALKAWIAYYGRQIRHADSRSEADPRIAQKRELLTASDRADGPFRYVEPLLRTTWDQGNYYNGMCPPDPDGPGGHCYAGCVATAVGQLMFYHRWPEQGTGEYSYTHPVYGELSANFGASTYNFNGMEISLNGHNAHIAQLLYHLGISFDMDYGPAGSGMWNHSAANSMRNYFKYGPQTQYIFRDTTTMNWDSILIANLDARKPLYYAGWEGVGSQNGHAFVCDGYDPDGFYHFNWGWSSSYDGYFLLSALTPGGSNFNFAQEVIKDIYPDTTLYNYPSYCTGYDTLTTIAGTFSDGSNIQFYPAGSECRWLIQPDEPDYDSISGIQISFPDFDLATEDRILIFSGNDTTAPPITELSGDEVPAVIEINASSATVVFDAQAGNDGGFLASFKGILPVYCSGTTNYNQASGMFDDGSGDKNYVNNSLCKWRIIPEQPVPLVLTFDNFNTETGRDFLKIYDLGNQSLIASLSGDTIPDPIVINSGKFYLVFNSDDSGNAPGWIIRWNPEGSVGASNDPFPGFSVYPNPAGYYLMIKSTAHIKAGITASVYNLSGQRLITGKLKSSGNHDFILNISGLKPGIYLIKLETDGPDNWLRFVKS